METKSDTKTTFDSYTEELLKKIKDENIPIDPAVWALLTHLLGNKLYTIILVLGDFLSTPKWILNIGSYSMIFLYKISGNKGKMYTIRESMQKAINNTSLIKEFLERLREATRQKVGF